MVAYLTNADRMWSDEQMLKMDHDFCNALTGAINRGLERMPIVERSVGTERPIFVPSPSVAPTTGGSPAGACADRGDYVKDPRGIWGRRAINHA